MTAETPDSGRESVRAQVKSSLQRDYRSWREQAGVLDTVHRVVETALAFGVVLRFVIQLAWYQGTVQTRAGEKTPVPEDRLRYELTTGFVVDAPSDAPWTLHDELNARIACTMAGGILWFYSVNLGVRATAPAAAVLLLAANGAVLLLDPAVMVVDQGRQRWLA